MNLDNVKYDAFISYRHSELDKFVAENLHKQLEAFKIPKSLIKAGKTGGKEKIERVFRDRDELPLASNLADPITQALKSSDYLIVICSPRLPESKWCLKEIETFINMHGRDRVLAVLIEGEPNESFPDILRYDEQEITDSEGNTHTIKVDVEPLAADVRGKDKEEVLKQIKNELMRLVAPMLGCNYDDLRMRHKEARQKRILRISLAISIVCLIFTAISTTMALTINKQANTIEEQYQTALETQSISYASISQTLLEQEDRMAAMAVARMALPDSLSAQTDKPYTAAAEYALSESLAIYNNGADNYPARTLEQNSPINFMQVSPDERTLTTVDSNNIITVYDIASAETIVSFAVKEDIVADIDSTANLSYLDADTLVYVASKGYCTYDIPTQKETHHILDDSAYYLITAAESYIGINTFNNFFVLDKNGNTLFTYEYPEYCSVNSAMAFDTEKSLCAFTVTKNKEIGEITQLIVANYNTGEIIYTTETEITNCKECVFYNNQIIVAGDQAELSIDNVIEVSSKLQVEAYPLDSSTPNWKLTKNGSTFDILTGAHEWENSTLIIAGYDEVIHINSNDGSLLKSTSLGSDIVNLTALVNDGYVIATTERGEKIVVPSEPNAQILTMEEFDISNGEFSDFYYSSNFVAAHHQKSTAIHIYQTLASDKIKTIGTVNDSIISGRYSTKQKAFITDGFNNSYCLQHQDSDTCITLPYEEYAYDMFFTGENDEYIILVNIDTLTYFDSTTGEQIKSVAVADAFTKIGDTPGNYITHTTDNNTLVYYSGSRESLYLYSIKDNTVTNITIAKPTNFNADSIGVNETADKYAVACIDDNTLSLFDIENNLLAETEINASLVSNIIVSDTANCVIVSHLDQTLTFYDLSDLSVTKTVTNLQSNVKKLELLHFTNTDNYSNAPVYALYGFNDCYLLSQDMELVAHLYSYLACDNESQTFYLTNDTAILAVPYYNYDQLIKEADKQLQNYQLSSYRKNQLGLQN